MEGVLNHSTTMESRSINTNKKKTIPYPKSIFIVILNEFCERFSYLGLRAILSIYLVEQLLYNENEASVIFHSFHFVAFCFPLVGSVIADSWLGKFKTIFYFSLVYVCGSIFITLASIEPFNLPNRTLTVSGLFIIAIGTGAIKTSVMPFGAEQFVLPQQQKQLATFYSVYYFFITFGGLLSTTVTPLLRKHLDCFEKDSCYSAAFGLPAIFMLLSVVLFYFAKKWYRLLPHEDNLIVRICKCICYAIKLKLQMKSLVSKNHWLDYSEEKYGEKLVEDIKLVLRVFFMFLPIPFYWALIEQTGTAWVFLARRMDGDLGFYTLSPDQMSLIGSIIYILLIPILQFVLIPRLEACGILRRPLQKMIVGGFFIVVAFLVAAGVSFTVESTSVFKGQLRIYNTLPCDVQISCLGVSLSIIKGGYFKNSSLTINGNQSFPFVLTSPCANISGDFVVIDKKVVSYFFKENQPLMLINDIEKDAIGLPLIRTLVNSNGYDVPSTINYIYEKINTQIKINTSNTTLHSITAGEYIIKIGVTEYQQKFTLGGVYTILAIASNISNFDISVVEVTPPHSIHMLWLILPGFILDIGIILFAVPGLEFAYSQAPVSMRTVIMAGWLLTTAFGNLIIVIIQTIEPFQQTFYNLLLYSALMLIDVIIFMVMAAKYEYVKNDEMTSTVIYNWE